MMRDILRTLPALGDARDGRMCKLVQLRWPAPSASQAGTSLPFSGEASWLLACDAPTPQNQALLWGTRMASLFDPTLTNLGFRRFFLMLFTASISSFALTVLFLFTWFPHSTVALELWVWWRESTFGEKVSTAVVFAAAYVAVYFYASLTIYDYLLAKRKSVEGRPGPSP
jgi:hypothetical protein